MRSPASTVERAGTSQRPRFPSAVYIPKDGMTMRCATKVDPSLAEQLVYRGYDVRGLRGIKGFENGGEGHRGLGCGDGLDRAIEPIETLIGDAGGDIARHRSGRRVLVHHHQAMGASDGIQNR